MRPAYYAVIGIAGAIVLTFVVKGCIWLFTSDYASAKVTKLRWEHTVALRQRTVAADSQWYSAPSRQGYYNEPTFNVHCVLRYNGTTCMSRDKDGICTFEVPDYDPWCTYNYYSWPVVNTTSDQGEGFETRWPTFNPDLVQYRETRKARYAVTFTKSDGFMWIWDTDNFQRYQNFNLEDIWELELPHVGSMSPHRKLSYEQI